MTDSLTDRSWTKRGLSLVWNSEEIGRIAGPTTAWSVRQLLRNSRSWPSELPSSNGNAVVVAGLDSCLDAFGPDSAEEWIRQEVVPVMLSFQDEYHGEAALIFWLPDGLKRLTHPSSQDQYGWRWGTHPELEPLALGRNLWAGAESDARRIVTAINGKLDPTGAGWVGLHLRRLA